MNSLPFGRFQFETVAELGAGGLGRVDKIRVTRSNASDVPVGRVLARKRLNSKWAAHPVMRERFEREVAALGRMSHPHIVTCVGQNIPGGERFYLMPVYTDTLRGLIAGNRHRGNWRFIAEHGALLAEALHYAHTQGYIHRDLKPENILFNNGGPLVIADWGLGYFVHKASVVLMNLTRGGMGTEYYCSIDQWNTGKCGPQGDIYSLGMTLDEWCTGAQRSIQVGRGISGPTTLATDAGARQFNALLQQMTLPFEFQRPATMLAVARALRAAITA